MYIVADFNLLFLATFVLDKLNIFITCRVIILCNLKLSNFSKVCFR